MQDAGDCLLKLGSAICIWFNCGRVERHLILLMLLSGFVQYRCLAVTEGFSVTLLLDREI